MSSLLGNKEPETSRERTPFCLATDSNRVNAFQASHVQAAHRYTATRRSLMFVQSTSRRRSDPPRSLTVPNKAIDPVQEQNATVRFDSPGSAAPHHRPHAGSTTERRRFPPPLPSSRTTKKPFDLRDIQKPQRLSPHVVQASFLEQIGRVALLEARSVRYELDKRSRQASTPADSSREATDRNRRPPIRRGLRWIVTTTAPQGQRLRPAQPPAASSFHRQALAPQPGMPFLDLIQKGNIGLIHTVSRTRLRPATVSTSAHLMDPADHLSHTITEQTRTIRIPVHIVKVVDKTHSIRSN